MNPELGLRREARLGAAWRGAQVALALLLLAGAAGAETLPPPPQAYFNDYAGLVSAADARGLDGKLRAFDQETSTQILVAIFPELPSPSLEDFTVRTTQSWRVGQKKLDNGAVLFVFVKDRKLRLEVGYGLEGALPDALAKRIIADTIAPAFKNGAYGQGLAAGIDAILAATRGEYQAPPATRTATSSGRAILGVIAFFLLMNFALSRGLSGRQVRRGTYRRSAWGSGGFWWGGGGGSSGGGGGGFSGGGFSGGGGSFGGGGASGDW